MKRLVMTCVVLAAFMLSTTALFAGALDEIQKRGKLRVGMEPGYMPFELTNKKGEIIGFDVDMAKRMAKAMDVELELVSTAWDGIIPALLTDKFDIIMSGMTLTQQRNMSINFAQPYIIIGQSALVANKHEGTIGYYKDLNDPKFTVTSKLGSVVPAKSSVRLSVALPSRGLVTTGASGGVKSMVTATTADGALLLPASSVAMAVRL